MPRQIALYLCLAFILWLYARDRTSRPMTSNMLWIVLAWIMIIGSKPFSLWFGGGVAPETQDDYLEGSPLDRYVFLALIVVGLVALFRRKMAWGRLVSSNGWLVAFFLYYGISIFWSDYPFVAFKRWTKDLGNIVMILVVLTESDPIRAFEAVLARFAYFAVPLSTVFIKYFPEIGRYYNRWTWEPSFCGITTNKNELGGVLFVSGLYLLWDLFGRRDAAQPRRDRKDLLGRWALVAMLFWLLAVADSSTAVVCLIVGTGIILFTNRPQARKHLQHLGAYSLTFGIVVLLLYSAPGLSEAFFSLVGRNSTLTGRTDLWADLLKEPINPLLGAGYKSFWLGAGAEHMWAKYSFHPVQAHNGYLETYLNGGLIGASLLLAMIISAGGKLKQEMLQGSSFGTLRFAFLVVTVFYNWTEAMFNAMSLVWMVVLIAALNYRHRPLPSVQHAETRQVNLQLKSPAISRPTPLPRERKVLDPAYRK
ncbi:MAG: O-antigen ligase family protein [Nitrospiraceae bacterium]|nr:O-antigen ligase family protein [Nitrospiraceae bacterium]